MLSDFFRINLPYGIARNDNGEWMAFNREYMPLGYNDMKYKKADNPNNSFLGLPIYTKYKNATENVLLKLAANDGESIKRDDKGKIKTVWFYNDATNPAGQPKDIKKCWDLYFEKLKILAKLQAK
jgi:hypothetical protein